MAYEFIGLLLTNNNTQTRTNERKILRQMEDPFDLSESEFKKLYRLSINQVYEVTNGIEHLLSHNRISGITPDKQALSAMRFYATGCFQRPIGEQWGIALSQTSISRSLHKVTVAINSTLLGKCVKFPKNTYERNCAKESFRNSPYPFEGCIGAINCTHVAIIAPKNYEVAYVNHHGYHSINVQMNCDSKLKILNVNAKFPGARHDAYIWGCSHVRNVMQSAFYSGERRTFLIDMGYPLEPWLMTPLPHEVPNTPRFLYNEALCKTRNCIERSYGVMKSTWRSLSKHRVLQYDPTFSGKIVNACTVLHNIKMHYNNDILDDRVAIENDVRVEIENDNQEELQSLAVARRAQNQIINQYFS